MEPRSRGPSWPPTSCGPSRSTRGAGVIFELKPLTQEAIPKALEKAERYRLLKEPAQAESICLDVLQIDPANQKALVMLLLALTDQFEQGMAGTVTQAREVLTRLTDEYARLYYAGIIAERRAGARLQHGGRGSEFVAFEWLREAMTWYEKAEAIRPAGNDDALLRWNTCARILTRNHPWSSRDENPRVPGEGAAAGVWGIGALRGCRDDARRGARGRGPARRARRREGAGPRGRARQGGWDQGRGRSGGCRAGRAAGPRHEAQDAADAARGHRGTLRARRRGVGRRARALPVDHPRPGPLDARGDGLPGGRDGDRGGRRAVAREDPPRVGAPVPGARGLSSPAAGVRPRPGRRAVQAGRRADPQSLRAVSGQGLLARRGESARRDPRCARPCPRCQTQLRRQRALPPQGDRGAPGHQRGGPARRRGVEVQPELHQARRQRRLHGQRRRPGDGDHGHHQARRR